MFQKFDDVLKLSSRSSSTAVIGSMVVSLCFGFVLGTCSVFMIKKFCFNLVSAGIGFSGTYGPSPKMIQRLFVWYLLFLIS